MVFKRHLEIELNQWKTRQNRKPLIIRGARQVGKTTLIKDFSGSYNTAARHAPTHYAPLRYINHQPKPAANTIPSGNKHLGVYQNIELRNLSGVGNPVIQKHPHKYP